MEGYGALDTVLVARKPLSDADIARAQAVFAHGVQRAIYYPGSAIPNQFRDLLLSPHPAEYERNYTFDITPVSDDRPFFFYTVQPRDLWEFMKGGANTADRKINNAVPLLFGLMAISLLATMVILIAPPLVLGTRLPTQPGIRGFLFYFLLIGAGYILIEVGLIQKFILFLGHPTYALTVVIFSMLMSSGLGSYYSRRVLAGDEGRMIKVLGLTALLTTLLALVLSSLLTGAGVAAVGAEDGDHGRADRAARVHHGDAVPHGLEAAGGMARAERAMGVEPECGGERAGFGGRAGVGDLSGAGADADHRRLVLPGCAGDHRAGEAARVSGAGIGPGTRGMTRHPMAEIEHALEAGEFVPYYQPIVDIRTGRLRGAEVLVRWRKPDGTLVLPGLSGGQECRGQAQKHR